MSFLRPTHPLIPQATPLSAALGENCHLSQGVRLPGTDFSWLEKRILT